MNVNQLRSKWAAVGAAIAVSLGAGGIGITHATTSSGERPVYLPIEPCRMADTRPEFLKGPRATPLGADETYTLAGWGSNGDCNLPNGTAGLALNVTALDATAPTFLTIFPADASEIPTASNLNPVPGQPPTPNAVNVDLDAAGMFSIYNLAGNVNIIVDVVGIYDDHNHDDRYYQKGEVDAAVGAKANSADVYTKTEVDDKTWSSTSLTNEPGVSFNYRANTFNPTTTPDSAVSTAIRVPSDGYVLVNVTGNWSHTTTGSPLARCSIQIDTENTPSSSSSPGWTYFDARGTIGAYQPFSAHAMLPIAVADNPALFFSGQLINFVCDEPSAGVTMDDIHISAVFFSTSYEPAGIILPLSGSDASAESTGGG